MYIINSNFILVKQVGDLSEKRIKLLKNNLTEFPEIHTPEQNVILFKKASSAIVISPTQLVFVYQGDYEELDISLISSTLTKVNDLLELSTSSPVAVKVELTEQTKQNTLETSKRIQSEVVDELGAYGVGLRFMVTKENYQGDIHIEPYIKDGTKYFLNFILESRSHVHIKDINSYLEDVLNFGVEHGCKAANKIFSI